MVAAGVHKRRGRPGGGGGIANASARHTGGSSVASGKGGGARAAAGGRGRRPGGLGRPWAIPANSASHPTLVGGGGVPGEERGREGVAGRPRQGKIVLTWGGSRAWDSGEGAPLAWENWGRGGVGEPRRGRKSEGVSVARGPAHGLGGQAW